MTQTVESAAAFAQYLYCRWQDEKDYEDFAEYQKAMQNKLPEGSTLTKFSRRPWRVEFCLADGTRKWVTATSRQYQWGGYRDAKP